MKRMALVLVALALVAGAASGGYWFATSRALNHVGPTIAGKNESDRKVLYWYDPMQPQRNR